MISDRKRIVVVGSCGSGKSYLSARLGQALGIPVTHLDRVYWKPGWESVEREEFDARLEEIMAADRWIVDGNYARTMERRIEGSDAVIFLDISRWVCLWSLIKRRNKPRDDMPENCEEKWGKDYFELLKMALDYPKKGRAQVLSLMEKYPHKPFIILKTRGQVNRFLKKAEMEK